MKLLRESDNPEYQLHADIWDLMQKNSEFFSDDDTCIIFMDNENDKFHIWKLKGIDRIKLKEYLLSLVPGAQKEETFDSEYEHHSETYIYDDEEGI